MHCISKPLLVLALAASMCHATPVDGQSHREDRGGLPPLSAEQIFRKASPAVAIIEVDDANGNIVRLGSAVAVIGSRSRSVAFSNRTPTVDDFIRDLWLMWKTSWVKRYPQSTFFATNAHVVSGHSRVWVRKARERWVGYVVGTDSGHDLALICVHNVFVNPAGISIRNTSDCGDHTPCAGILNVGERVYAIGAPLGLEDSISDGIISGLRSSGPNEERVIQLTAPVSPGSSGAGLFDSKGDLVGIVRSTLTEGQNVNFAIPIDSLRRLSPR